LLHGFGGVRSVGSCSAYRSRVDSFHRRHRFAGTFVGALKIADTDAFCTSCHEMNEPFQEYRHGMHYSNVLGIQASCGKCHVPPRLVPGLIRHIQASREVWGHLIFELSTPAKYEAHRLELAQKSGRISRRMIPPSAVVATRRAPWRLPSSLRRRRMSINRWRRRHDLH